MKKSVKRFSVLLAVAFIICALSGCQSKNKLASCFNEKDVKALACEDITLAESDNFEGWQARFAPEYQSVVTEASYDAYKATLTKYGAFQEFGKTAVIGQEKDGKNYAVAIVICKHEDGDIKYTVAYDENMNLIQFTI